MGSSKKQTVGYKYYLGMHLILCHGPVDFLKRITVDGRNAWSGSSSGGQISVQAEGLFGGEEREGGVSGTVDVEMGRPDQGVNSYLLSKLGPDVPSFRKVLGVVLRQCYLGMNPYLKPWSFRAQRIHVRQEGIAQWYDAKAAIPLALDLPPIRTEYINLDGNSADTTPVRGFTISGLSPELVVVFTKPADLASLAWSPWNADDSVTPIPPPVPGHTWCNSFRVRRADGSDIVFNTSFYATPQQAFDAAQSFFPVQVTGSSSYTVWLQDENTGDNRGALSLLAKVYEPNHWDMNPAHIIRECLTDPDWGMGYADADVDEASFVYAADKLYDEGMGISLLWDRQTPLEDFINEIVKHISASLYVDRSTGKFVLKLIRDDYDRDALLQLGPDNIQKIEGATRPTAGELVNSVTAVYWNAVSGENGSLTVQDQALVQMQGAVINTTLQYPGFTNSTVASKAALRALTSLSIPLLSCTVYADRRAASLNIGDVFRLSWPDLDVHDVVMRVTGLALGDGRSNVVKLTVVEDIFSFPEVAPVVVDDVPPTDASDPSAPAGVAHLRAAMEMPYYEAVQQFGQGSVDATLASGPDSGYVMAGCGRPGAELSVTMQTDPGTGFEDVAVFDFCPAARLSVGVGRTDATLLVVDGVDLDRVEAGSYAYLGGELVRIDGLDLEASPVEVYVGRATLDTVPVTHPAGEPIVFLDVDSGVDPTEYVEGEHVGVRLLPSSGSGRVPEANAPVDTVVMGSRAFRSYPPGDVRINGEYFPVNPSGDLEFTWAHRDRVQQTGGTLADFTTPSIGPEPGTTYNLRVYGRDDELLHEEAGIAGTAYTYTNAQELADMGGGGGGSGDPNWAQVSSLLHFDGVDGATTITDVKGLTWTLVGNARLDTSRVKYGSAALLLDGTDDYAWASDASLNLGGGDYTVEGWAYYDATSFSAYRCIFSTFSAQEYGRIFVMIEPDGDLFYTEQGPNGSPNLGGATTTKAPFRTWFHWAAVRSGTTMRLFKDGVKIGEWTSQPVNNYFAGHFRVGRLDSGVYEFGWLGSVDELRVTKGVARYSADFTPPAAPYPDGTFVDGLSPRLRIELESERDGRTSYQRHDFEILRSGYGVNYGNLYGGY